MVEEKRLATLRSLLRLYSSWVTVGLNLFLFGFYYAMFYFLIRYSNFGLYLVTLPSPLLFLLVLSSSALATIALLYIRLSLRLRGALGVAQSPVTLLLGAIVASCACNLPLVAPVLYFLGLNALEVSGLISSLASLQEYIIGALILLNLVSAYYYLRLTAIGEGDRFDLSRDGHV